MRFEKKKLERYLPSILCVLAGACLWFVLTFFAAPAGVVDEQGRIERERYGSGEKSVALMVGGLDAEEVSVRIPVSARAYTGEEAEEVFYEVMDGMEERIRADNASLLSVTTDLSLPSAIAGTGVAVSWHSSDPTALSSSGRVLTETETQLTLTAVLSADGYEGVFDMPVRIVPKELSETQARVQAFLQAVRGQDEAQKEEAYLKLPDSFAGSALTYREETDGYGAVFLLAVAAALLFPLREKSGEKERKKKRETELLTDYSDLVSKLMILTGAGFTVRNAWERMVRDYERGLRQDGQPQRAAYEEMRITAGQMENGMAEGAAYREFGRRCRLQPYMKLSSLLEQNRKAGLKNLRALLEAEMADAFELRKNMARRMGEEAGTKLLAPLFMLLGIVMVMIMVPAMMSMG